MDRVIWECPNLLTFGEQRVLLFSAGAQDELLYSLYVAGTFRDEHFSPQTTGILVHGGYFYAPQVLRDKRGRYIMWGWLREGRKSALSQEAGWAEVMSLPVMIAPLPEGKLRALDLSSLFAKGEPGSGHSKSGTWPSIWKL